MTVDFADTTYRRIDVLARKLSDEFGFDVTPEQAVLWMLKRADVPLSVTPWEREAEALCRSGEKIVAIKLVREKTGMGLKDAKDLVERRWQPLLDAARKA